MYLARTLESFIKKSAGQFPVLMVVGARQVGKTTFLKHLSENMTYVSLDDPLVLALAKNDPALFFQRFTPPLLIDEIQYAPELLPYIKIAVDEGNDKSLFWLTGSQQFHLMKGVSESLAGRIAMVRLLGLSRKEMLGQYNQLSPFLPLKERVLFQVENAPQLKLEELYKIIWRGAFPYIALNDNVDWSLFYNSYVQTYLQRDVRDLARVGDEMAFLRFLRTTAARTGQMLNISELAKDSGIAVNTAKQWLSILETSGIVYLLEPYYTNITKRLVKTPKIYMLDTGLCSFLTEWSSPKTLEAGAMSGAILETWVIAELLKSYWHNGRNAPFYYYRDKDGKEIDLLIVQDNTIYPLEIKKTAAPNKGDVKHFKALEKLNLPIGDGGVICLVEHSLPLTTEAISIPIAIL